MWPQVKEAPARPGAGRNVSHCLCYRGWRQKKKAEDKGEKLHPAQAKGSDSDQEEPTFEGKGSPRETHPNQGQFHRHSEIDYTTMWKRQDHTAKM